MPFLPPSDKTRKTLEGWLIFPVSPQPKKSDPVRPDPTTDSFEQILDQPGEGACHSCGSSVGLYVVRGDHHLLCAPCTQARIEKCSPPWPEWVAVLHEQVIYEIRQRAYLEKKKYTLSWDLTKCSNCGRMIRVDDARYALPPQVKGKGLLEATRYPDGTMIVSLPSGEKFVVPPLCSQCHEVVKQDEAKDTGPGGTDVRG